METSCAAKPTKPVVEISFLQTTMDFYCLKGKVTCHRSCQCLSLSKAITNFLLQLRVLWILWSVWLLRKRGKRREMQLRNAISKCLILCLFLWFSFYLSQTEAIWQGSLKISFLIFLKFLSSQTEDKGLRVLMRSLGLLFGSDICLPWSWVFWVICPILERKLAWNY